MVNPNNCLPELPPKYSERESSGSIGFHIYSNPNTSASCIQDALLKTSKEYFSKSNLCFSCNYKGFFLYKCIYMYMKIISWMKFKKKKISWLLKNPTLSPTNVAKIIYNTDISFSCLAWQKWDEFGGKSGICWLTWLNWSLIWKSRAD